jgi:glycosyltransferase involved in cell wall biosynthesis
VLHNGVPDLGLRDPALRTSNEPLRVLTIGRLAPHKRPDVAVRAVAEAARPIELTIAGDGPLRSALDVLAETLEVDARFLGHVEDLAGTYARCHVVLLASESEGLPLVAMEAASAGRPVVADRSLDGMQEVLEGAMLPANDSSAEALARVLRRCFDDSDGLVTLGALARRRFDEFDMSLSGAADRFVETYRRR